MSIALNHTIVWCRDREISPRFLAAILGLDVGEQTEVFLPLVLANDVTLDYADASAERDIATQHYAFLVNDDEFDAAFARLKRADIGFWGDPFQHQPAQINHLNGGRGVYFADPDGHYMELLTRA
jgi:catechol 2,3-dioxygenase-like lactoylglutathione lyase family enzyme